MASAAGANSLGIPDAEYQALVALSNSTNGPGWTHHDNWLTAGAPWYGVTVTSGHVTSIDLSYNQLSGAIPSQLGSFPNLRNLYLHGNQLSGAIPPELGNLTNLQYLYLYNNQLSGTIPSQLGDLANLQGLYLDGNQLSGTIPSELGNLTNLRNLYLHGNQLSGAIPPELGNLTNLQYLYVYNNQLSGTIPSQLGNLTNLQYLYLYNNQLSGTIPSQLGNLTNLRNLYLYNNQLSGTIPSQLGNLTNLRNLYLYNNQLSGTIPSQLGNLTNLQGLWLGWNQLSGAIPPELGNLTNLKYLGLSSNQIVGDVPSSIVNLVNLVPGQNNSVSYNGLSSGNGAVLTFMSAKFPAWQDTQTVPPANVSASAFGSGSVVVSWTPIAYTGDGGYYEVGISQTSGGPYTFSAQNRTTSKSATQLTVTALGPGANYLVVRTLTPANSNNQNTVTSLLSTEVYAMAAGVKSYADGVSVEIQGVMTAGFGGFFYVENADRLYGIRVVWSGPAPGSGKVDVTGVLRTNPAGERYMEASGVTPAGSGSVTPLGVANRLLGGADWHYDPATGAGQCGVWGEKTMNNIGLLVRIWGKVTLAGRGWFYIDDGSGVSDGSGIRGVYVDAEGRSVPSVGAYTCVTGISSCDRYLGHVVNTLLAAGIISEAPH